MKLKYVLLLSLLIIFITTIVLTRKKPASYGILKSEAGIPASGELLNNYNAIKGLEDDQRKNPENVKIKLKLAQAYVQEGRVTGDHSYYDALAFRMVNDILKDDDSNFEALCVKAILQASAHQFKDALQTSQSAIKINSYNSYIYGVQCDAYVELGKYDEAVKTADKMVSLRPDISSYSRISYLREIIGDYPGAIQAMKLALSAGAPGLEQTEWSRVYLGRLYEVTGKKTEAESCYKQALLNREHYSPAIAGLARISKSKKDYSLAIRLYSDAAKSMQDYSFHHELALLYRLTNEREKTEKEFTKSLDLLIKHKHPTSEENGIGHNVDRELSLVYASMQQYDQALNCANMEYERRPDNIDVNETLAWANYNSKNYAVAQFHILKSLKTKSKNAELWYKAGLIFKANKYDILGNQYLDIALKTNPSLDTSIFKNDLQHKPVAAK